MKVYSMALGRRPNSDDDPPDRWVALASLSAVIAFLIGSLFETNFYDSEVVILTYFLMALPFIYNGKACLETGTTHRTHIS